MTPRSVRAAAIVADVMSTAAARMTRTSSARGVQRPAAPTTSRLTTTRQAKRNRATSTTSRARTRRRLRSTRPRIPTMAIR
jgi:hypothetical protein